MVDRLRTAAAHAVEYVRTSESRRVTVAIGVAFSFLVVVELAAGEHLGVLPVVVAAGLAAYLYTRGSARETLAASAYGTGLLLIGLFVLQIHWVGATGSTESLGAAVSRLLGWLLAGTVLTAVGIWLRRL